MANTFYLVYEPSHFAATKAPGQVLKYFYNNNNKRWCHTCCKCWSSEVTANHTCDGIGQAPPRRLAKTTCKVCGYLGRHPKSEPCPSVTCATCKLHYDRGTFTHRCLIVKPERREGANNFVGQPGIEADGKHKAIFAYDLESR